MVSYLEVSPLLASIYSILRLFSRMEYIEFALSDKCQPVFDDPETTSWTHALDKEVLDSRCQEWDTFLSVPEQRGADEALLKKSLESFFESNSLRDQNFVLSLSGGVDSMSMAVLLKELGIRFVAVHIRHSSRLEDTEKELDWVRFVCKNLCIPLYHHHVLVARPHGEDNVGELTRDMFEEKTRDIRFCMYTKAFKLAFGDNNGITRVLIGHHIDDVDENRIAELGKGNLINLDGMSETSCFADVVQLRPLCTFVRKCTIRNFALARHIPHMHNSTPKWSRRGWIRDVLDNDEAMRSSFLTQLSELGAQSSSIDQMVFKVAKEWVDNGGVHGFARQLNLRSKAKHIRLPCSVFAVNHLLDRIRSEQLVEKFERILVHAKEFGNQWNSYFANFADTQRPGVNCPIQPVRLNQYSTPEGVASEILNRVFQTIFASLRDILETEKFVPKKSVSQLLEAISSKVAFSWKVANKDLFLVKVKGSWYVLGEVDANTKKAITTNLEKVEITDLHENI